MKKYYLVLPICGEDEIISSFLVRLYIFWISLDGHGYEVQSIQKGTVEARGLSKGL